MKYRSHDDFPIIQMRVVDSDTIQAWVEVSFGVALQHYIRLKGIEGGEMHEATGFANAEYLRMLCRDPHFSPCFMVGCLRERDLHGRIVADIRMANNALLCHSLLSTGRWWTRKARKPEGGQ